MKPLVLIPNGDGDASFFYATGFAVETGVYVRFPDGEDVLSVSPLEFDRAREQSSAGRVEVDREAYQQDAWAALAAAMVRRKGFDAVRVSANLRAADLEDLRAAGLDVEVDRDLFRAERRQKGPEQVAAILEAQQAAEAAVVEVARNLARADIKDGELWLDGSRLTSERLNAAAQSALAELGFVCPEMIIAGSPGCALPHFLGEGPIQANAPVIIDIFPSSRRTHYYGDLTRTLVVGKVSDDVRRMHEAAVQALEAGIESIRAGVTGRDVHRIVCQVLVDRGYGTTTAGFEGPDGVAKMNHSTGHGVGLEVHELPGLREVAAYPLSDGDVVTVEPGLYLLGMGGVRVEDTGMVTSNGFQNFTKLTYSLDPRDYL
ncbi:MAG: M24 family metallopeptidase [Candidatus Dormibacteraceae bacterium]